MKLREKDLPGLRAAWKKSRNAKEFDYYGEVSNRWFVGCNVPKVKDLDKLVYQAVTARPELLDMSNIHDGWFTRENITCDTKHCIAGWAVHICPDDSGYALASEVDCNIAAAALIYYMNTGSIPTFSQYVPNDKALNVLKKRAKAAEKQASK